MKTKTTLMALGALGAAGAVGAAAFGVRHFLRKRRESDIDWGFDTSDVTFDDESAGDEPVVIAEEVVVISEVGPYDVDVELVPATPSDMPRNR